MNLSIVAKRRTAAPSAHMMHGPPARKKPTVHIDNVVACSAAHPRVPGKSTDLAGKPAPQFLVYARLNACLPCCTTQINRLRDRRGVAVNAVALLKYSSPTKGSKQHKKAAQTTPISCWLRGPPVKAVGGTAPLSTHVHPAHPIHQNCHVALCLAHTPPQAGAASACCCGFRRCCSCLLRLPPLQLHQLPQRSAAPMCAVTHACACMAAWPHAHGAPCHDNAEPLDYQTLAQPTVSVIACPPRAALSS